MTDDLSLTSTDDLLDELISRFDHVCFVGSIDRTDAEHLVLRRWDGNAHTIIGLSEDVKEFVRQDYYNNMDQEDDDD